MNRNNESLYDVFLDRYEDIEKIKARCSNNYSLKRVKGLIDELLYKYKTKEKIDRIGAAYFVGPGKYILKISRVEIIGLQVKGRVRALTDTTEITFNINEERIIETFIVVNNELKELTLE